MRTLARLAVTLGVLVVLGYFVAALTGDVHLGPFDEPGVTGKVSVRSLSGSR